MSISEKVVSYFTVLLVVVIVILIGILFIAPQNEDVDKAFKEGYEKGYEEGYHDGYDEVIIDYYDDIIDLLIENAVLEERIEWLEYLQEKQYIDIDLIKNDVDDLMEITIRYYESEYVNIMTLEEYIQWEDPSLYQRILNEWK
jgi:hypothetical protein